MSMRPALHAALVALMLGLAPACGSTAASTCSPATCASGCCDQDDRCVGGAAADACGVGGNLCNTCSGGQVCQAQVCTLPVPDAGSTGGGAGGGGGGGAGGGGGTADAGVPTAITAPAETWTWVGFPDAVCGNGVATGLGVNLTTRSTDVFLYLQGGGACWERFTCLILNTAANLQSGYTRASFEADTFTRTTALSRTAAVNPLKDMSWVYVPYCTGDVHAGDAVRAYDGSQPTRLVHHKGAKNMEAYLKRLALTFPGARRIYLSGSSAGAFGAQLNYERVVAAFPAAEVHVLADSGQMVNPLQGRLSDWLSAWNLVTPPGCATCATDFTAFPRYLAERYPTRRFALLAFEQDTVLTPFFGYGTPADFRVATQGLLTGSYDPTANARYFVKPDADHTMLGELGTTVGPGGVTLSAWLTRFVAGGADWVSVKP